ncbi:MAG: transglycosylase SLT domain-containing protein [Bacteriovoracaceae bacterium]|nr:transglycosylase SLT domain-containing protein [Bacteriovoracaceae bacterium]
MKYILVMSFLIFSSGNLYALRFNSKKYTTKYDHHFKKYTKRYFANILEWTWFKAQGIAESNLKSNAKSWVNAKGVMQVMPRTYQSIKKELGILGDILNPKWNIAAGLYYDRKMWNYWKTKRPLKDRIFFMFASYNAGAATILRAQRTCKRAGMNENLWHNIAKIAPKVRKWRQKETLGYIKKINRLHRDPL